MEQSEFDNLIDILKEKALNGDVDAMRNLGDAYYQGPTGKEKNISAAFPYWKKAADNGDAFLALKVAYAYIRGDGCEQDDEMAFYYFQLAADGGNVESQYNVGLCCENGIGCPENLEKAKKYYRMAALSMNGEAQWRLGAILFNEKNTECYHWICCAHISGVSKATDFLNQMIQDGFDGNLLKYQISQIEKNGVDPAKSSINNSNGDSSSSGGCYIATCVYGSYDCPEVWTLRRFRDEILLTTKYGQLFVRVYYFISPTIVKYFGKVKFFKLSWRKILDRLVNRLKDKGISSEPYADKNFH